MDVVNFETAKALKEAGFPQKIYKNRGQIGVFCYRIRFPDGTARKVVKHIMTADGPTPLDGLEACFDSEAIFAPTATDILREMPESDLRFEKEQNIWHFSNPWNGLGYSYSNENPAEACAEAWIALNTKNKRNERA